MTDDAALRPIRRALLSVSDKSGLVDFARALGAAGVTLISTGGTARSLREAGLAVTDVAEVTGMPEMMDGRVKTLHPKIHGGLLALRDSPSHAAAMAAHAIAGIDLLVVNLYPFEETVAREAGWESAIENIDIGGPAMIRSAAKNHAYVTVAVDPGDYAAVLADMDAHEGATTGALRRRLAAAAFARTAAYDAAIAGWFAAHADETYPPRLLLAATRVETLRYGENPHQTAAFYRTGETRPGIATARQVQGKALSYNNLNDTDAAYELVGELGDAQPAVAIIKHANPCGVAVGASLVEAYEKALACDPLSAFGGIVAVNRPLDALTARAITRLFTEVVIAPGADEAALEVFAAKKNLRLLLSGALPDPAQPGRVLRSVAGGILVQSRDNGVIDFDACKVVTRRRPSARERDDLILAFKIAKHVKSNAIVYVKDGASVGLGAGQMSRVDAARIAARKAEDAARAAGKSVPLSHGSVVASDAFFPFADGLLAAVEAGASAVIQPGGSLRDEEVIAAADAHDIAMVMTGMRHFRH
ncbi:MAG: bifunctional phosphoribosylaminoimidazolecarboxamide formyltransferase/IMP cyclohydrolase [Pseudomonadota bacterium]